MPPPAPKPTLESSGGRVTAAWLAQIPLFSGMDENERTELAARMKPEACPANQTIFWMGDKGDTFYIILNGQVAITVPNEKGEHVVLNTLGPGGFFGEISLLDGGPRTATVRAIEPCEFGVLGRSAFQNFLISIPHAAIDILTVMGRRQRTSTEALRLMKNPNIVFDQAQTSWWQRVSDIIATVAASQWFTLFHVAWFGTWIAINTLGPLFVIGAILVPDDKQAELPGWIFDPFPFGLLTMVVSLEAIFLSIFVMVSQNRQGEKDRLRIDLDYQINLKAETEIVRLARRLESLEERLVDRLSINQSQQPPT